MGKLKNMKIKFTVVKNDDLYAYLNDNERNDFYSLIEKINHARKLNGKKDNTYLVINTDEPYANEIIKVLKKNGHWG